MAFNIVLVEPEIPQNTGNIVRTAAATGCKVHLIKPIGFDISDRALKRAGLDYWHLTDFIVYENLEEFLIKTQMAESTKQRTAVGTLTAMTKERPHRIFTFARQRRKRDTTRQSSAQTISCFWQRIKRVARRAFARQLRYDNPHTNGQRGALAQSFKFGRNRCVRGYAPTWF